MKHTVLLVTLLLAGVAGAETQQGDIVPVTYPRMFPGSFSSSNGLYSPFEDSAISRNRVEQGWTALRWQSSAIVPFVSFEGTFDERGYDWNNKTAFSVGVKGTKTFDSGIIQVGTAYTKERRFKSDRTDSQFTGFANYWFGWDNLAYGSRDRRPFSSFPGSSWGNVGNVSPIEGNNIIGMTYARQGTVLTRVGPLALVPFGDFLLKRDTDEYDWNNGHVAGLGGSVSIPLRAGILEAGWAYKWEWRHISGNRAEGGTWFINFWTGWNPFLR